MKTKTGWEAIEAAKTNSALVLNKYSDPIEDDRSGLTVDEAVEVAREDPSLIWLAAEDL